MQGAEGFSKMSVFHWAEYTVTVTWCLFCWIAITSYIQFKHTFPHPVPQLLCNDEVSQVILHSHRVVTQQCVRVAQTVARLCLNCSIPKLLCQYQGASTIKIISHRPCHTCSSHRHTTNISAHTCNALQLLQTLPEKCASCPGCCWHVVLLLCPQIHELSSTSVKSNQKYLLSG